MKVSSKVEAITLIVPSIGIFGGLMRLVSYINQKKALKEQIIKAVDTARTLDKEKLIAELCLNTGFTEKTVKKMLQQMAELDYIKIDGLVITRPDTQTPGTAGP